MTYVPFTDGRRRTRAMLDELEDELRQAAKLDNDPSPRLFDISPIVRLLDAGYDLYGDIIPVVRSIAAARMKYGNWAYYAKVIEARRSKNLELKPKGGEVVENTIWILRSDDRWPEWAEAWHRVKGKQCPVVPGLGGPGWHFPTALMATGNASKEEPAHQADERVQASSAVTTISTQDVDQKDGQCKADQRGELSRSRVSEPPKDLASI